MGSKKNVDMAATTNEVKIVEAEVKTLDSTSQPEESQDNKAPAKVKKQARSKKYQAVRAQVDKTKDYDAFSAVELIKKLSYSKFAGSIEAHLIVKEVGTSVTFAFPHSTGKSIKVAVASDEVLQQIEDGNIDFDVLISTPKFMPKLTKYARVLGPKGMMPNPKNGTLTPNPEVKKKELEAGTMTIKTEKKAPLIHLVIGKTDMETKDLVENIESLLKALKGRVNKLTISATMSPGVKIKID